MINILQGSVVTQTALGGLTIYPPVENFYGVCVQKKYESWLTVDKVLAIIIRRTFGAANIARFSVTADLYLGPLYWMIGSK